MMMSLLMMLVVMFVGTFSFQPSPSTNNHCKILRMAGEIVDVRQIKVSSIISSRILVLFIIFLQGIQDGMKMKRLPHSDLIVSELCLGTMMFGEQLTKEQAFEQLDAATSRYGINFLVSLLRVR